MVTWPAFSSKAVALLEVVGAKTKQLCNDVNELVLVLASGQVQAMQAPKWGVGILVCGVEDDSGFRNFRLYCDKIAEVYSGDGYYMISYSIFIKVCVYS